MPSKGHAQWNGGLKSGSGDFTAGDSISGAFSFKSRFEDGPGANPEQLIAAAHASCFSMAFSAALEEAGHTPTSITTDASVTLKITDDGPAITKIVLTTEGDVPGIDDAKFQEIAAQAKAGCPVSKALAGVEDIQLEASLKS
jgi:lipoyl-dependent peroxiredoxin